MSSQSLALRFADYDDTSLPNSPKRDKTAVCRYCAKGDHSRHGEICCKETVAPPPRDHVCSCKEGIIVSKWDLPKPVKRLTRTPMPAEFIPEDYVVDEVTL